MEKKFNRCPACPSLYFCPIENIHIHCHLRYLQHVILFACVVSVCSVDLFVCMFATHMLSNWCWLNLLVFCLHAHVLLSCCSLRSLGCSISWTVLQQKSTDVDNTVLVLTGFVLYRHIKIYLDKILMKYIYKCIYLSQVLVRWNHVWTFFYVEHITLR